MPNEILTKWIEARRGVPNEMRMKFDATHSAIRTDDLNRWLAFNDDDEGNRQMPSMPNGCEYYPESNTITINGVITDDDMVEYLGGTGYASPGMLRAAIKLAAPGWALEINSPGGSVYSAMEIVTILRKDRPAMCVVSGIAASAAAIIALTSDQRWAGNEMCMLMFHAPWGCACGNAVELGEVVKLLGQIETGFIEFVSKSVGDAGAKEINKAIKTGNDLFLTAAEATELGILNGVLENEPAAATPAAPEMTPPENHQPPPGITSTGDQPPAPDMPAAARPASPAVFL